MIKIFENIINTYSNESITMVTLVSVLFMVSVLAIYEFFVYRFVSRKSFCNKSFNVTIAILPFFISTIILCLQANVIITLGTIGVLAIIKFRAAIKDPLDMLYLLWSVNIGIICGCGLFEVGVITSIIVTIVLVILEHIDFSRKPFVLIIYSSEDIEKELVSKFEDMNINNKFKSKSYTGDGYNYSVFITTKNIEKLKQELKNNEKIVKYSIIEYDIYMQYVHKYEE